MSRKRRRNAARLLIVSLVYLPCCITRLQRLSERYGTEVRIKDGVGVISV